MTKPIDRAEASRIWFSKNVRRGPSSEILDDPAFLAAVRSMRSRIRDDEGGGGMCHVVTEWLQAEHGFDRHLVSYLTREGDVCFSSHFVSVFADGTIFDPTADQLGQGHDLRILKPGDPDYGCYRPEFGEDYDPGTSEDLAVFAPFWNGLSDDDASDANRTERGSWWWADDLPSLVAHLEEQIVHAGKCAYGFAENDGEGFRRSADEIEERMRAAPAFA